MSWMELLSEVLKTVLVVTIPLVATYIVQFIKIKTANEKLNEYIGLATDAVQTAVLETSQIFVDALKADGAFTGEKAKEALDIALDRAKQLMGDAAQLAIEKFMGDADGWIIAAIEAQVKSLK